ncbi:MAG: ribonuclease III [Patescibacteria group bacterium]
MKTLTPLEERLGVKFKNQDLLRSAVTHRSYLNEHPEFKLDHNERLEFLGDAVLELAVTRHLFENYPDPEGELTNWRASLVNRINLAHIGERLGIEEHIVMSKGEAKDANSKARQLIVSNALEAIIGAIYLDQGMPAVKKFIQDNFLSGLGEIIAKKLYLDPKSEFQEKAQSQEGITPNYKILSSSGPDHDKKFKVGAYLNNELIASGTGSSKQEAQIEAARKALAKKDWK